MNKEQFEELKQNLKQHHRKGVGNTYTADPIFLVQVKKINRGYEEEYASEHCIYFDSEEYDSVADFIESHSLDDEEELEYFLDGVEEKVKPRFRANINSWDLDDLWHWIDSFLPEHEYQYLHGNYRWETINWFLTRTQAENFMYGKGYTKGDDNGRIYVDCLYRSHEFQGLLDAVIDGELEWKDG